MNGYLTRHRVPKGVHPDLVWSFVVRYNREVYRWVGYDGKHLVTRPGEFAEPGAPFWGEFWQGI